MRPGNRTYRGPNAQPKDMNIFSRDQHSRSLAFFLGRSATTGPPRSMSMYVCIISQALCFCFCVFEVRTNAESRMEQSCFAIVPKEIIENPGRKISQIHTHTIMSSECEFEPGCNGENGEGQTAVSCNMDIGSM